MKIIRIMSLSKNVKERNAVVDLGTEGTRNVCLPWDTISSFSCTFQEKNSQIIGWWPLRDWHLSWKSWIRHWNENSAGIEAALHLMSASAVKPYHRGLLYIAHNTQLAIWGGGG